jgi:hypothetical protein
MWVYEVSICLTCSSHRDIAYQNGVMRIEDPFQLMLDQSREKFRKPIPPKPEPMKFATGFLGATQHKNASEEVMGKTYSGKNCQRVIPPKHEKKMIICRFASGLWRS